MSRRPAPLPAPLSAGPFTVAEALAAGVPAGRLRRSDLVTPLRGVRLPGVQLPSARLPADGEPDLVDRCRAAMRVLPPGSAFSHGTALRLLGADVPGRLESDVVHARIPVTGPRPSRRGLVVHTSRFPGRTVLVEGMAVSVPERAWLDCASLVAGHELIALGDSLVRRQHPLTTVAALTAFVAAAPPGTRGIARLRAALPEVRAGTDSLMETRTRLVLVGAGLPCPAVNVPLYDATGTFLAMPDLTYAEARIAIEYDGDIHRTDRVTWMRDIARRERLQAAGWLVLTVTADDVLRRPAELAARVRRALRERTPH